MHYSADITAGSLKVKESRAIATLLLSNATQDAWAQAIGPDNLLQARTPATAQRLTRLIRNRLETMEPPLWSLIEEGTSSVATQACLAAAVKHSVLLADFFDLTLRDQYKMFAKNLSPSLWEDYIADCTTRDPKVGQWSDSTVRKLRTVVFHILEQAGYINSTRTATLQTVHIEPSVAKYLDKHHDDQILRCIRMSA